MKKLVFIISLFLSVSVLSADIKDLTKGSDLDQAYRKKWESTHNNGEGGPEVIQYQNVDGVIYDQHGNRYVLEGTYTVTNSDGTTVEKNCADAAFLTDPTMDWSLPENYEKYPFGSLAGPECKKVLENAIEEIEVKENFNPDKSKVLSTPPVVTFEKKNNIACYNFFGQASVNIWSDPMKVYNHFGPTTFAVTANPVYPALTLNWVRFWNTSEKWEDRHFKGTTNIAVGNAVASIWMSFISYDKNMTMIGYIC